MSVLPGCWDTVGMQTGVPTLTHGMKRCRALQVDKLVRLCHSVVVLEHGEPVPHHVSPGPCPTSRPDGR